jgi:hypothetical protein
MLDVTPHDEQPEIERPKPARGAPSPGTLLIAAVLVIGLGYFLSMKLRDMGRIQDCAMSGRTNCAPISGGKE